MAFAPTPKQPGDLIKSKDWNDALAEVVRLEQAKFNNTGGAITGPLTVAGALAVGPIAPDRTLTVSGAGPTYLNVKANNGAQEVLLGADAAGGIVSTMTNHDLQLRAGANVTRMILKANGNVGIGTPNPLFASHVVAGGGFGTEDGAGVSLGGGVPLVVQSNSTAFGILNAAGRPAFALNIDGTSNAANARGIPTFYDKFDGNWHAGISLQNGNVGIGTQTPAYTLDVRAGAGIKLGLEGNGGGQLILASNHNDNRVWLEAFSADGANNATEFLLTGRNGGNVPQLSIHADKLIVSGSIKGGETAEGWILGGGGITDNWLRLTKVQGAGPYHDLAVGQFWANGALRFDLAEVTPAAEADGLEQGDAVVIDGENGLCVCRSQQPYDSCVYGIVSSYDQAAMVIGGDVEPQALKGRSDKVPIALIGRVKAKVTAENGPIRVGDLLTTSAKPGHLMRCEDQSRHAGSIAGKALEPLANGQGMITILVTLQ
jgi:hypothetical protein